MKEDPLSVENTLWANTVLASGTCTLDVHVHVCTVLYMCSTCTYVHIVYRPPVVVDVLHVRACKVCI